MNSSTRQLSESETAFNTVFIIVIVLVTVVSSLAVYFRDWWGDVNDFEPRRSERSGVVKDAGMLGMTIVERRIVINELLQSTIFTQKKSKIEKIRAAELDKISVDESYRSGLSCKSCSSVETFVADTETSCVVCMMDYVDGDELVKGTHCDHKFHKRCLLEWLGEGDHDECPLCREKMMTPSEFKDAASKCIKAKRLQRIIAINDGRTEVGVSGIGGIFLLPSIRRAGSNQVVSTSGGNSTAEDTGSDREAVSDSV